jgi:hypothetical protein
MAMVSATWRRTSAGSGCVAGVDFALGGGDEFVDQVVGLDAEPFASGDFDVGAGAVFVAEFDAEFAAGAGVRATIS